jgi:AcrR family transcriptional regulator
MDGRRQEILDAALALADEQGLDAVSMRAVARRAGVTAMALYPYVGSKAELLDGMMGRLLSELLPPAAAEPQDWRGRLRALAHSARNLYYAHPWASGLLFSRPAVDPDAVRVVDLIYTALIEAGVPAAEVPRVERLASTVILGFVASEVGGRFGPGDLDPRRRRALLAGQPFPGHRAVARWLAAPVDWDAEFETDLDDLARLIEAIATSGQEVLHQERGADGHHPQARTPGNHAGGGGPG